MLLMLSLVSLFMVLPLLGLSKKSPAAPAEHHCRKLGVSGVSAKPPQRL
jgi:hypothetical protein